MVALRITSGGELLINTTSDAGDYKLQVNGNSYLNGLSVMSATSDEKLKITGGTNQNLIRFDGAASGNSFALLSYVNGFLLYNYTTSTDALLISNTTNNATFSSSVTAGGIVSSATEFRLNNQTYSRVATLGSGGDFGGGYNFNWVNGSPVHAETGSISGYGYGNDGSVRFYANASQSAGVAASERMRITSAGNVGIGTSQSGGSLTRQLEVYTASGATTGNTYIRFGNGSAGAYGGNVHLEFAYNDYSNTNVFSIPAKIQAAFDADGSGYANGNLLFYTKGTAGSGSPSERMRITSGGNVGIGTTSPAGKLEIVGSSGGLSLKLPSGEWYGASSTNRMAFDNPNQLFHTGGASGKYKFRNAADTDDVMTITNTGNVGIGTTSPNIVGFSGTVLTVNGTTTSGYEIGISNASRMSLVTDGSNGYISTRNAGMNLIFETGATSEKMRLTSSGELLLNTTSDAGDYKLQVNGAGYFANASGVPSLALRSSSTSFALMSILGNQTGDVSWLLMSGYPNAGDFTIRQSDVIDALTINKTTGNATFSGSIKTAAPSGGTAKPWKLGEAGVTLGGSNTSGVRVEIDGVVYYLVTGYLP